MPGVADEDGRPSPPSGRDDGPRSPRAFDRSFWIFFLLAIVSAAACWAVKGEAVFRQTLFGDLRLLAEILPRIVAALCVAALVQVLIPRKAVAEALGDEAGLRGVALAAGAGALTPGGPMTSFPLVSALHNAGSGRGALIAYLTSWSTLGFQRILSWEIPLMGIEFTAIRLAASLPLPFVAAAISALLPKPARDPAS